MTSDEMTNHMSIHRIPIYNSSRLADADVIATFAARQLLLGRLLDQLGGEKPNSRAQHHLLVGQRGMGKTLLLARIAAELRTGPLAERFIPLVFAEEQYAVDRLSKFWLNCLDSLADEEDRAGHHKAVEHIDAIVNRLNAQLAKSGNDELLAREAVEAFLQAARETERRPVLLVDNVQLVFERLSEEENHRLREILMRSGCPILVGASPSPPPESQDYGAAFYDHFKVHYLRPLDLQEMQLVLSHLADVMGSSDVRQRIQKNLNRLAVLRQLTGGNPRTTVTLFLLYAEDFSPSVFSDLENLLDRATPLYKSQFEELSPQQQVIASAIADHWDPITSRLIADNTGLAQSQISPQLDRMERTGFLEKVELFGNASTGYQLAERFFNIWFLMRSASRRQRRQVEFLTRFLQSFYEAHERARLARHLMAESHFSSDRYLLTCAVADSLPDRLMGEDLKRYAQLSVLGERNRGARQKIEKILDLSVLPPATLAFDQLRQNLMSLVPTTAGVTTQEFAEKILGDSQMFRYGTRERLASRSEPLSSEEIRNTLEFLEQCHKAEINEYGEDAVAWFSSRLVKGQLRSAHDAEDWNRAFQAAKTKECVQFMVDTLPPDFGREILDDTFNRIREFLAPTNNEAMEWFSWGYVLSENLERYEESRVSYRKAIELDPQMQQAWYYMGNLLLIHFQSYEETEAAYRKAIDLEPQFAGAWHNLGLLLAKYLKRYEEAEEAYRKAIEIDPASARTWHNLAALLDELTRYEEAEAAYRKAIEIDSQRPQTWFYLGKMLHIHFQRYEEAEAAYRKAIEIDPQSQGIWNNLALLLAKHLQRYEEAEAAYRKAIEIDPQKARCWANLALFLEKYLARYEEAEAAYRKAIEIDPQYAGAWHNLGLLLAEHLQSYEDAEAAYRKTIELDPEDSAAWHNLGLLLAEYLQRYEEAETAFRKAIELDPQYADSWHNLAILLEELHRYEEAELAFRKAIEIDPESSYTWNSLGILLQDHLGHYHEADSAYIRSITLDPTNSAAHENMISLRRDFLGEAETARPLLKSLIAAIDGQESSSIALQEALFCAYESNWGLASKSFALALDTSGVEFPSITGMDWLRAGAVLLHLNYGKELLLFLRERGDNTRFRPWYEAVNALYLGDRRYLQNVAPEIRGTAEKFYDQMEHHLKGLPESTRRRPLSPPPKVRKQTKRGNFRGKQ